MDMWNVERRGMGREIAASAVLSNFIFGIQYMLSKEL